MKKVIWLSLYATVLIWSAIAPKDYFTWFLEVVPALIGLVLLVVTYSRFPLTSLLYSLILLHAIVLMIGGHYTYAGVPLFDAMKSWFGFERNNYDKLGHFMQGLMPAILAREILVRRQVVKSPGWLNLFVVTLCLAFSALYEIAEWWVAIVIGASAEAFLGTQGYVWDTQSDMMLALIGACFALVAFWRWHDKQLAKLSATAWFVQRGG